jgi:hypothetical protein
MQIRSHQTLHLFGRVREVDLTPAGAPARNQRLSYTSSQAHETRKIESRAEQIVMISTETEAFNTGIRELASAISSRTRLSVTGAPSLIVGDAASMALAHSSDDLNLQAAV